MPKTLRQLLLSVYVSSWSRKAPRELGFSKVSLLRWLRGRHPVPPQVIAALARRARRRLAGLEEEYRKRQEADRVALIEALQLAEQVLRAYGVKKF